MKKLLISIIILILGVIAYFTVFRGLSVFGIEISSIQGIKEMNQELDKEIKTASQKTSQDYPVATQKMETSIKNLKIAKEEYETKIKSLSEEEEESVFNPQIETYKIEYLWTIVGNYAKDRNILLTLDVEQGNGQDVYNIEFTLVGDYVNITDFIYDVENDDELNFYISDFKITPNSEVAKTEEDGEEKTQVTTDTSKLKATFSVNDIGIIFN